MQYLNTSSSDSEYDSDNGYDSDNEVNSDSDKEGVTPLFSAAQNGHETGVATLLAAGADVNTTTTDYGMTPLLVASLNGHKSVVLALIAADADVNQASTDGTLTTDEGATPLYLATQNGHKAIVAALIAAGADVNKARTDYGVTPLFIASQNDHEVIVAALIAAGADVNKARIDIGSTPLYVAALRGHKAVVLALIAAGADVNKAKTDIGAPPLFIAALNGDEAIVAALVEAGARVHHRTHKGSTARDAARTNGHDSLLRLLRSPVAWARWRRSIVLVRAVVAFLAKDRAFVLRNVDPIFSAASGGVLTKVPDVFVCPITWELLHDPVMAADGFTYERRAIEQHLLKVGHRSPKTNLQLTNKTLVPNVNLRIYIRDTIRCGRAILAQNRAEVEQARKQAYAQVVHAEPEPKQQRLQ